MKFHHISLRVKNFEKSLKFYTELVGLKIGKQFSAGGGNVAYLFDAEGDTEVELIAMPEGRCLKERVCFCALPQTTLKRFTARLFCSV